jgi:hypothetical protein
MLLDQAKREGEMNKRVILVLVLCLMGACQGPCGPMLCPPGQEVVGDPSQFSLGPAEGELISISAPEACQRLAEGHRVVLTTYGDTAVNYGANTQPDQVDASVWLHQELRGALEQGGVQVHATAYGLSCVEDGATLIVAIWDWSQADEAARITGRLMREGDLNVQVELQVVNEQAACADTEVAC